jgi:ubiquinone/menaquinone biosynthesis C-methylase UbiE
MFWLRKMPAGEPLNVAMAGVRSGDRLLILGADSPKAIAQLALKPGLNGRTCIVDEDARRVQRAAAAAEREGALVEHQTSAVTTVPYDAESFDVVVVNHLLPRLDAGRRAQCLAEAARVVRAGGRCVVIQTGRGVGLAGLFGGGSTMGATEVEARLTGTGFRAVHTLAEREGLLFVEGARRS